jgi:hypothetical protein
MSKNLASSCAHGSRVGRLLYGVFAVVCVTAVLAVVLGPQLLRASRECRLLTDLAARGGVFRDRAGQVVRPNPLSVSLVSCTERIVSATFEHARIGDEQLSQLTLFPNLRDLRVIDCPVTPAGLQKLRDLGRLRSLWLGGDRIDDRAAASVAALAGLEQLVLDYTAVGDEGLAKLTGCSRLRELSLAGTQITNDGLRAALEMRELESLNLDRTAISEVGLVHLTRHDRLKQLSLLNTQLTDDSADVLSRFELETPLKVSGKNISSDGLRRIFEGQNGGVLRM